MAHVPAHVQGFIVVAGVKVEPRLRIHHGVDVDSACFIYCVRGLMAVGAAEASEHIYGACRHVVGFKLVSFVISPCVARLFVQVLPFFSFFFCMRRPERYVLFLVNGRRAEFDVRG